ncbi:MAG TPA: response regulator, partial [Casimicrobiaceae bacterium]|nr:response regulator [Casimicrobiaceae bacterium]
MAAPRVQGQERLLVVEDDAAVRRAICELLESAGYEVLPAGSGPEALQVWEEQRASVDLVLT